MIKKLFIYAALFIFCSQGFSQQANFEGRVDYLFTTESNPFLEYHYQISEKGFRLASDLIAALGPEIPEIIFDSKDTLYLQIDHSRKSILILDRHNESHIVDKVVPIQEVGEHLGYACKKYEVYTFIDGSRKATRKSIYWVSDQHKLLWLESLDRVAKGSEIIGRTSLFSNGLVLKIETFDSQGNLQSDISAINVVDEKLGKDYLAFPVDEYMIRNK